MSQLSRYESVRLTGMSAMLHFLVDGLCICCLHLTTVNCTHIVVTYVTYNVLAFLTQPLTGWWADRMRQKHWMLLTSVLLLTVAVALAGLMKGGLPQTTAVAFVLGLGNSLFHVWGGKQTAVTTGNDIRALGVFVSTGAFGLAVGAVFASWTLLYAFLLTICLLAVVMLNVTSPQHVLPEGDASLLPSSFRGRGRSSCWLLALILLIVAGRSFTGEAFTADLTKGTALILLLGFTSMAGKMAGGWIVKGLGMWKAVLQMVAGTILCLIGKDLHIVLLLAGLFWVNCTMPVTLYWANALLKRREGLAFGLLAAALMPGYLLAVTGQTALHLFAALIPTILIEWGVLWLLLERRRKVLLSSVAVNVLTNVPLNLYVIHVNDSLGTILIGEVLVILIEAAWYWLFTRSIKQAAIYSLLCNAISFLIGLLFFCLTYHSLFTIK